MSLNMVPQRCQHVPINKTLVDFKQDKYYNYKGVVDEMAEMEEEDNNGLVIRAYEASFCADTGATFDMRCARLSSTS
eukprot:8066272-Ditylum_brightwellii.AAC.1